MPKGRAWTTQEVAYLRKWAGIKSVYELHRKIKRPRHAIENMASRLGLSLRVVGTDQNLVWCPRCAKPRTKLAKGICPVCRSRERLAQMKTNEAELLLRLSPKERALKRPHLRGSRADERPTLIATSPEATERARAAVRGHNARIEEEWEARNVRRELAATRRRVERLKKQLEISSTASNFLGSLPPDRGKRI